MGLFRKKSKPKEGAVKTVNGIHYAYRNGKWVKMSDKAQANINKNDALNQANVGGTHTLTNKNQPKANLNRSNQTKSNNNKSKTTTKKGPVVKSVGTVDFNINTPKGLTAYNKALKASKGLTTDKEKDKSTTQVLYGNRNKLSSKDFKKLSLSNKNDDKKGNNFKSTVHTRHYKTGERLGVMTRNQRRAYEKEAGDKTFESQVAKHEKDSKHGKSHLRETLYKSNVRKTDRAARKTNREGLKMGRMERTAGSPLHQPGGKLSRYNKDGTLKKKKR
tara:strand:+ start:35 stop:859 length:825 start_codon:yes stop_codon:yes gene_type:complete